jgi:hypothetical protein
MCVGLDAAEIVDRDRNEIASPALHDRPQKQPADSPKTVDPNPSQRYLKFSASSYLD